MGAGFENGRMRTTYMRVNAIKSLESLGVSAGCVVVLAPWVANNSPDG